MDATTPAPDPDALHRAYCGPARGFSVCYCECPVCRDDAGLCRCPGCGAWQHRLTKIVDI